MMTKPVRHIKCGHVYDKASVLLMMKTHYKKGFRSVAGYYVLLHNVISILIPMIYKMRHDSMLAGNFL